MAQQKFPPENPGCPQGSRDPRSHFIYPYN
ncbi:hypothetical protein HKBW3S03_02037, partial [Candidatus Hakubella thermalkaliphila]